MHVCGCFGRSGFRLAAFGLFGLLLVTAVCSGCTDLSADDAERLFVQALDAIRTEGLRPVPAEEQGDPTMIVRRRGPAWQPSPDVAGLAGQARSVSLADRNQAGGETVLCIELEPDAAKSLLEERLMAELDAVRRDSTALLQGVAASESDGGGAARGIRERVNAAERQLASMLATARVETTLFLQVDRRTARPSGLQMVTRIVRPGGLQETLTDFFVFA